MAKKKAAQPGQRRKSADGIKRSKTASSEERILQPPKAKKRATGAANLPAGAPGSAESGSQRIVRGRISRPDGSPAAGVLVRAYDIDLRHEEPLGDEVRAHSDGRYEITYTAAQFRRAEKGSADLRVCVRDEKGSELVSSEVLFNAPAEAMLDITLPAEPELRSEFELLVNAILPLLQGQGQDGQDLPITELEAKDIFFLTQETGQPSERIALLVAAAKASLAAGPASTMEVKRRVNDSDHPAVHAEAFYGWFRQGLPASLPDLLAQNAQVLRESLERSVRDNIIPKLSDRELDEIVNKLMELKAGLMLKPADRDQPASLGDLLQTTSLSPDKQRRIAALQVEHGGETDAFWKALNEVEDFDAHEIDELRLTLPLGRLTGNHLPLIVELQRAAPADRVGTPGQDLTIAQLNASVLRPFAHLDAADWKEILLRLQDDGQPIGAPPTTPGADLKEKVDNYAADLNRFIENALPTAVVASRLDKDSDEDSPFKTVKDDLKTFFDNNPSFELGATPVEMYLAEGRDAKLSNVADSLAMVAHLKNLQRVFKITPRYPEIRALLADDLHSAGAMVAVGERRFVEKYAAPLGGPGKALETYRKAERVHATALHVFMRYDASFNSPLPYVIAGDLAERTARVYGETGSHLAAVMLPDYRASAQGFDWRTLFGSLDLCDCEHCRSLYSPAAYLVDILKYLDNGPRVKMSPLRVLLSRRPDIEHIELTCENTDTQLPYVDLVNELLEAAIVPRAFKIAEGADINTVLGDLKAEKVPATFGTIFSQNGYPLTDKASVRIDKTSGVESTSKWLILDRGWAFELVYQGTHEGFRVMAWPQTSWTAAELKANPEHVHDPAYGVLRGAVYPWILPLNLPVEEMRVYLGHLGVKRHELMEAFHQGTFLEALCDKSIARETLGLTTEEADIITGKTTGAPAGTASTPGAWDFWGLRETGNDIADPNDPRLPHVQGDWDAVLKRVSIFLQQSGLSYQELLELLGAYFINPSVNRARRLGIVSIDPADPATCQLDKLEIQVLVQSLDITEKKQLIKAWNRSHRFVRLWRKLGWTMRDLDKTLTTLTPNVGPGALGITEDFLAGVSHIQRLRASLNIPLPEILSWWADIDTASYIDHLAEGQPEVSSLYDQLFRNKTVIKPVDEAFTEDASRLAGNLSGHLPALVAAFGIKAADLALLTAGTDAVVSNDNLNLTNLSKLYRVVSLARALKLTIPEYLSIRKLSGLDPFAPITPAPPRAPAPATAATLLFVEKVKALRASGFTIEELEYLLRHDFHPLSVIAPSEDAIAATLDEIRAGLAQITAENTLHEDPGGPEGVTADPDGDLTRKKLAALNWDTALIEQVIATLNGSVTYEALTDTFLTGLDLPNDTGTFEVDLPSLPLGFSFPDELMGAVAVVPKFLFACDADIPVESTAGNLSTELNDKFVENSINLGPNPPVVSETPDTAWRIKGQYSVVKNGGLLSVYDQENIKLRASRLLSGPERVQLQSLAASSNDNGFISATKRLIEIQDQLQGRITYEKVVLNGQDRGLLRFTGPMTNTRKARLDQVSTVQAYRDAVQALYDAPRKFIIRHARTFSVQDFSAELAALPDSVKFPKALQGRVYYDTATEPKKLHFVGVMTEQQRDVLLSLSTNLADPSHALYQDAVRKLFAQPDAVTATFLTGSDAATLFDAPTAPGERFLVVLRKLLPHLRRTISEYLVAQTVAEALSLEAKTASSLLTKWVNSPTQPAQKSISEFLAPAFAESNLSARPTAAAFPDQFKTFTLLHKISMLITKLNITSDQVDWLFVNEKTGSWLDLNALPVTPTNAQSSSETLFAGWERLVDLFRLRGLMPLGEMGLFDLFDLVLAAAPSNLNAVRSAAKQRYLEGLSQRTLWPLEDLEVLLGARNEHREKGVLGFVFHGDYIDERKLSQLRECFRLMKRLGGSAAQLGDWAKADQTDNEERTNAIAIKNAVKAKYDNKQWLEVAKPLRDQLRENQRAALVAFLVTHPDPMKGWRWQDANGLYGHFLIDVEMDPCMLTTRIKQAISSVQLFVQRCLMSRERGVYLTPEDAREWAQWRKWYRVWEANRKVLFYPENWIESELRDDKSPFFKDLEDELLQGDVTMDTAEDALLHYLEKLDQVARLEIVGLYRQKEPQDILHVFGRTYTVPHIYFYRRLEGSVWSAWEKVDLDIEGDHLIPVVWNRRLHLFWAIFTEKEERPTKQQRQNNEDSPKYWEIKLAWSEYKNRAWSSKKLSKDRLVHCQYPYSPSNPPLEVPQEPRDFSFKTRILQRPEGEQLTIECYGTIVQTRQEQQPTPPPPTVPFVLTSRQQLEPHEIWPAKVPTAVKFSVLIDGLPPTAAERAKINIELRNLNPSGNTAEPATGGMLETLSLTTNGNAYSNLFFSHAITWNLNFAGFRLVSSEDGGSWTFLAHEHLAFFGEAVADAVADAQASAANAAQANVAGSVGTALIVEAAGAAAGAGGLPGASAVAAIAAVRASAALFIAAGGASAAVANAATVAILRTFGRRVVLKLAALPVPPPLDPVFVTRTAIQRMQASGQFAMDDCSGDLVTLGVEFPPMSPEQLEALTHTRIQNMMFEEQPGEHWLTISTRRDPILDRTPGVFRLLAPHQDPWFNPQSPFFFQDGQRTYFVSSEPLIRFTVHFHPVVCDLVKALKRDGIPGLLTLANQQVSDSGWTFWDRYSPEPLYIAFDDAPKEDVDFERQGAYSLYNWELFFHVPFLIAMQLSKNQRFEEAQKWFHYIFDPTATDSPRGLGIERFWRVKPFYDEALQGTQTLETLLTDAGKIDAQIDEWSANPFKPHAVARLRVVAYMKAVVMRYLDNLIAWGDQLFRRDTLESINEATQLYVLAAQILGKRPENIPPRARAKLQTFRTLEDKTDTGELNSLSNAVAEIEVFIPPASAPTSSAGTQGGALLMPFFCITANDKLLGYWDTVADRLFKIRHCMNIEGVERSLPPFEPAIETGLLVRAAAAGVDIASVLNDINAAVPAYRFNVMLQKATELCNDVKALGAALLSALEKKDGEELALLRSSHELALLKAIREVKKQQAEEANNTLAGLIKYQAVVTARQQYYLSRPFMNPSETSHMNLMTASLIPMSAHLGAEVTAAILHLIPNTKVGFFTTAGVTYGGDNTASAVQAFGSAAGTTASILSTIASISATLGGYQRRQEDWAHQADLATKELEQVQKQILAAEIRVAIAERELENHDLQTENAKAVDDYLRHRKFTNQALYSWMVGKLSGIYFQGYQLAYDVAKRAERAYRHELGLRDSSFIQFGYWDSLKKGLLSGEKLHHDLKRMDVAFLDQNRREYEITKHISLITLDPISLIRLKETGECTVVLPEALFDIDYPGHYMRRLKSVSITIPCVAGPYAGVNCTLTQLNSSIRHANALPAGKYARKGDDPRFSDSFGAIQSIVTSSGQNDSGLFEANFRDERYLPFEGQGAISTWRIELPTHFKPFDYDTISDVVLHLRYTAREGGALLRQHAVAELSELVDSFVQPDGQQGLARIFSLRHEFPTEWHRFLNPAASTPAAQTLTMALTRERFPFLVQDRITDINMMELLVKIKPEYSVSHNESTLQLSLQAGTAASNTPATLSAWNGLLRTAESSGGSLGNWTLTAWLDAGGGVKQRLEPNAIQDILLVCRYTCL